MASSVGLSVMAPLRERRPRRPGGGGGGPGAPVARAATTGGTRPAYDGPAGVSDALDLTGSVLAPVRSVSMLDPRTPVLAGVGQVTRRPEAGLAVEERAEPVALMADALREAAVDCGGNGAGDRLLRKAGSLRIVRPVTWRYRNPAKWVAERLGIEPAELAVGPIGGNTPLAIVNGAAQAIAAGDLEAVLVAGGDCLYTRLAARRDPDRPLLAWTDEPADTPEPVLLGTDRNPVTDVEEQRGLDRPNQVFPLFENARRAVAGRSVEDHNRFIAGLWARLSEVAAANPYAWSRRRRSAEELGRVDRDNRMVSFPYPKLLNANDRVDQGAALILCSLGAARAAGVPEDRIVFPWVVTEANDHWFLTHRHDLHSSPAMEVAGRRAFALAGCGPDDVAHVDLYSCFPCALQMGAEALGFPVDDPDRPLSVTGGLAFAGGPVNNYVGHSVATLAGRLRDDPGSVGLATGLGWYATKHAVSLWSTRPPEAGYRWESPQAEVDARPQRAPASDFAGMAEVETYTVVFDRENQPELGILALLTPDGRRTWGNVTDVDALWALTREEGCGREARLGSEGRAELR